MIILAIEKYHYSYHYWCTLFDLVSRETSVWIACTSRLFSFTEEKRAVNGVFETGSARLVLGVATRVENQSLGNVAAQ